MNNLKHQHLIELLQTCGKKANGMIFGLVVGYYADSLIKELQREEVNLPYTQDLIMQLADFVDTVAGSKRLPEIALSKGIGDQLRHAFQQSNERWQQQRPKTPQIVLAAPDSGNCWVDGMRPEDAEE